eukprot:Skav218894  [mRNA]  locus=scaffold328:218414:223791:+ [translate_table: standard]
MGCSSSSPSRAPLPPQDNYCELSPSSLNIGNRSETECSPKIARREYNSWKHEVDLTDLKLIEEGMSLPVNQWVSKQMSEEMSRDLSDFLGEPGKLAETIKARRLKLEEVQIGTRSEALTTAPVSETASKSMNLDDSKDVAYGLTSMDTSKASASDRPVRLNSRPGQSLVVGL